MDGHLEKKILSKKWQELSFDPSKFIGVDNKMQEIHMKKKTTVLIVEDDESVLFLMESLVSKEYNTLTAQNGVDALEVLKNKEDIAVIITDLRMPQMGGKELIENFNTFNRNTVIIITTVIDDIQTVIQLMQKNVYDYITKPFSDKRFLYAVNKAVEIYELKRMKSLINKEREIRVQRQLEWNLWKEEILKRDIDNSDSNLLDSIRSNLTQGSGIGALVSIIGMIKESGEIKDGQFIVDQSLMELLFENNSVAEKIIQTLAEISNIGKNKLELKEMRVLDLYNLLQDRISILKKYIIINNHNIKLEKLKQDFYDNKVLIHKEYFEKVVDEIILNSLKYSIPESNIYILLKVSQGLLFLSCLNSPEKNLDGSYGIPEEMKGLVFEPFFRNVKYINDMYGCLDVGLGLSLVEKIVQRHDGKIHCTNVKEYVDFTPSQIMVLFEIELPII